MPVFISINNVELKKRVVLMKNVKFEKSPYVDCVSSISSYRCKKSFRSTKAHKERNFRTALHANIKSCKLMIKQEEDALLESVEDRAFYSAGIMRVVQKLVVSSAGRTVQKAFGWWHQRTGILRAEEEKRKKLLKSKRNCVDDFIGESIQTAIGNIITNQGKEKVRKTVLLVQKVTRIRGKNMLINAGDGRESLFAIPRPR